MLFGAFGVIFTTAYDLFKPGPAEFGRKQFMGFVVSILVLLAGLRNTFHSKKRQLDATMLCIYLLGMLYLVLRSNSYFPDFHKGFLEITAFFPIDFGINVLGFFPLGYLSLPVLYPDRGKRCNRGMVVMVVMVVISSFILSLLIEVAQYHIQGRTSSVNDIAANGLGSIFGILYYHIEAKIFNLQH